ncbi:MAG: CRTAC1 family protein [Myxococcales bacterium]|nr:CRTAC1 family protein [Myxococcales bacterium]
MSLLRHTSGPRFLVAAALPLLPLVLALPAACSATATPGGGGGTADDGGSAVVAPGTECTARELVAPAQNYLKDISEKSGIQKGNFVPSPATPIPINDHSRLALVDVDGDGWDDAVMHSLFPNPQKGIPFEHLVFRNKHDGTFEDISEASGLRGVQAGFLVFADVDNDGDQDCFAGLDIDLPGQTSVVLLNDGRGHFTPKAGSGVERVKYVANAVFADFDNDGKVDLFLGNGHTSYAAKNAFLLGKGDGTFTDVTGERLPGVPAQPTDGLVACDYDDDGDLDVFVSTYGVSVRNGWNQLWENDGKGAFTDVASERGFAALATGNYFNPRTGNGKDAQPVTPDKIVGSNGFGVDCADITGDGLPDVWLTTISHADGADESRLWSDPSQLLVNKGRDAGFALANEFLSRGLPYNEGDIDAAIVDFDNDGRLDLSVTRTDKYEASFSDPQQKGYFGLFHQGADGAFTSLGLTSGVNDTAPGGKRGKAGQNLAWADIDHDGDADLLFGARDQGGGRANLLFENTLGQDNTWLALQVRGDGAKVHGDAFGTKVTVRVGDRVIVREKKSSRGTYDSIDGSTLLFGLGGLPACAAGRNAATLEIRWPDGTVDKYGREAFSLRSYLRATYGQKKLEPIK